VTVVIAGETRRPFNKYCCHTRESGYPVIAGGNESLRQRGVLDYPLEPVIGLAEGETRWRMMTSEVAARFRKPGNDP
jgi:hypothetical protein